MTDTADTAMLREMCERLIAASTPLSKNYTPSAPDIYFVARWCLDHLGNRGSEATVDAVAEWLGEYFMMGKIMSRPYAAKLLAAFPGLGGQQLKPVCPVPPGSDKPVSTETASE